MQWVEGLGAIAGRYDGLIVDLWGVMHDGLRAWPEAVEATARFRAGGGRVILLSNAPRPADIVAAHMTRIGVDPGCYDRLVTSGDATRAALERRVVPGRRLYHLGPGRDRSTWDGLDWEMVDDPADADAILATGLFDDTTETAEDYRDMLAACAARGVPLLCANPDIVVMRGDQALVCAGALAALYQTLGGRALLWGKPHREVYDHVLGLLDLPAGRVLAIGDSLETDMAGAAGIGADAMIVTSGIHGSSWIGADGRPDRARIAADCAAHGLAPAWGAERLRW